MNDLKAIHVEGKMTLVFDENVTLHLEETKETTIETSDLSSGLFGQFLNMLFHEGNMSLEEQTKVMQMTVADFCAMYDTTSLAHQENDNPIPPGIPRMQFLQNIKQHKCPRCNQKGSFELVDGHLKCAVCLHDFGDVDDLKETLSM